MFTDSLAFFFLGDQVFFRIMSKVNQRTTFWHSAPSKRISRGTDPQDTRASTRTGLPPIELHPSISFEETFVRGKNFGTFLLYFFRILI